jgi:hypothetical protein
LTIKNKDSSIVLTLITSTFNLENMKKLLFIFAIILISISCSKEFDLDQFPQEWKLISMSTDQISPSTITGSEMEWQETYAFNSDGTFTKSRIRDGISSAATGTFEFKDTSDKKYFELTFVTGISLVTSCSPGKEVLLVLSETKLLGDWAPCDGIGLIYERIK